MTEKKRFTVIQEEYQDTDDMGYAIAPPLSYYYASNSEIGFNFDDEREANRFADYINQIIDENKELKQQLKNEGYDDTFETRIIHSVVEDICYLIDDRIRNVLPKRYHQANMFNAASTELKNLKKDIRRSCE